MCGEIGEEGGDFVGSVVEIGDFEGSEWAVPDDGFGFLEDFFKFFTGLWSDISGDFIFGDGGLDLCGGMRLEFWGGDMVEGEVDFRGVEEWLDLGEEFFLDRAVSGRLSEGVEEGVAHCAAEEEEVHFREEMLDEGEFIFDFGST